MESKDIEGIVMTVVRMTYGRYPGLEWDDLVGQAYLIVTEKIEGYDKSRGTSLSTYLFNEITYGLSDYVRRNILKEQNLHGLRDHSDYLEAVTGGFEDQLQAKMTLATMADAEYGVSRDILMLMIEGYTQSEISRQLGFSKQYISQILKKIREKYL